MICSALTLVAIGWRRPCGTIIHPSSSELSLTERELTLLQPHEGGAIDRGLGKSSRKTVVNGAGRYGGMAKGDRDLVQINDKIPDTVEAGD